MDFVTTSNPSALDNSAHCALLPEQGAPMIAKNPGRVAWTAVLYTSSVVVSADSGTGVSRPVMAKWAVISPMPLASESKTSSLPPASVYLCLHLARESPEASSEKTLSMLKPASRAGMSSTRRGNPSKIALRTPTADRSSVTRLTMNDAGMDLPSANMAAICCPRLVFLSNSLSSNSSTSKCMVSALRSDHLLANVVRPEAGAPTTKIEDGNTARRTSANTAALTRSRAVPGPGLATARQHGTRDKHFFTSIALISACTAGPKCLAALLSDSRRLPKPVSRSTTDSRSIASALVACSKTTWWSHGNRLSRDSLSSTVRG
mmetsp:Transcript_29841/g.71672  ORF Transcript_29841/g.71672 Transcript_29841/m.71672 type:complete len:319 (+) Transcript_29841:1122-2078(+)